MGLYFVQKKIYNLHYVYTVVKEIMYSLVLTDI